MQRVKMPFNLTKVNNTQKKLTALEDKIVDKAEKSINNSLIAISNEMEKVARGFETDSQDNVVVSGKNISLATTMINALQPALQEVAEGTKNELLSELGEVSGELTNMLNSAGFQQSGNVADKIDANVVGTFLNLDLDKFNNGAEATTKAIQDRLFGMITGANSFDDMVVAIKDSVKNDSFVAKNARTWAVSAVVSYQNSVMQNALPDEEVGGFYYSGVIDNKNRDFCRVRVGKIFSKEQIAKDVANNPVGNSSMRLPGGWNCRHVLVPVPLESDLLKSKIAKEGAKVAPEPTLEA
jgi:hypothetical protein